MIKFLKVSQTEMKESKGKSAVWRFPIFFQYLHIEDRRFI